MKKLKKKKGFTLIELIVVIAIIGILSAILIPGLMNKTTDAKVATANANAKIVHQTVSNCLQELMVNDAYVAGKFQGTAGTPAATKPVVSSGDHTDGDSEVVDYINYALGANFKGEWYCEVNSSGVVFATYSNVTGSLPTTQQTQADLDAGKGKFGCYPIAP